MLPYRHQQFFKNFWSGSTVDLEINWRLTVECPAFTGNPTSTASSDVRPRKSGKAKFAKTTSQSKMTKWRPIVFHYYMPGVDKLVEWKSHLQKATNTSEPQNHFTRRMQVLDKMISSAWNITNVLFINRLLFDLLVSENLENTLLKLYKLIL